jgi:hypothetical protein
MCLRQEATLDTKTAFNGAMSDPVAFSNASTCYGSAGTNEPERMKQGIEKLRLPMKRKSARVFAVPGTITNGRRGAGICRLCTAAVPAEAKGPRRRGRVKRGRAGLPIALLGAFHGPPPGSWVDQSR